VSIVPGAGARKTLSGSYDAVGCGDGLPFEIAPFVALKSETLATGPSSVRLAVLDVFAVTLSAMAPLPSGPVAFVPENVLAVKMSLPIGAETVNEHSTPLVTLLQFGFGFVGVGALRL